MAVVTSVNISEKKGVRKNEVPEIVLKRDVGIEGDAHAGDWHRQISLLAEESVDKAKEKLPSLTPGAFAENINTRGLELYSLPVGTKMKIGSALVEVTQIGKACHDDGCAIKKATGDCVMPREGIFVVVLENGAVRAGDSIEVLS
jgi:MOSC domain-containing protein YiiM